MSNLKPDQAQNAESVTFSVKVSYAVSHLLAAATVLREQGLTGEADETIRLAEHLRAVQTARNEAALNDGSESA